MKDRLEELKNHINHGRVPSEMDDTLMFDNHAFEKTETNPIEKFLQEVAELSLALAELEGLSQLTDKKQQGVLCCTAEESVFKEKNELHVIIIKASFASQAQLIQPQLSTIQAQAGHRLYYRDIINHHYACETQNMVRLKEKMVRQAELAGVKLQEEDLEKLVANPVPPQMVGCDLDVLNAKQGLALAEVCQRQLLDLEYHISELHSVFFQVEMFVSGQHELLDSIEYNILHTQDYVEQSNETVKKALKCKRQSSFLMVVSTVSGLCACCTCLSCITRPVH
ncbi:syntaxin-3-like [Mesocricetus auratus]|uniref:Syntaxin-3-like n=1 Tax=Mesocricetus auratus TaxID=10036 RepID=A0A1U7QNZ4_MESAU|nr:syntaxin-3-like [Mesocricetus auratus]